MDKRLCNSTHIIILAAGKGSRISNYTKQPKSLLQISNKSILESNIEKFINVGAKNFTLVLGYKDYLFKKIINTYKNNINIKIAKNKNYITKGNSYSLLLGLKKANSKCIFLDGDIMIDFKILKHFLESKKINLALVGKGDISDKECAKVFINKHKKIKYMIDKKFAEQDVLVSSKFLGEAVGIIRLDNNYRKKLIFILNKFLGDKKNLKKNWENPLNIFMSKNNLDYFYTKSNKWIEIDNKQDYFKAKRIF